MARRLLLLLVATWLVGCAGVEPAGTPASAPVSSANDVPASTIGRAELRAAFTPPSQALAVCRVVPVEGTDGQRGLRLFGIRMGSLLARAGLVNGDLVLRLQGVALTSTHVAREVAEAMVEAEMIEVEIERQDALVRLRVRVLPDR